MTQERKLTGRHVLMIFVGAFGVIITVNLLLAYNAVRTFPGLEVKNSYVASQKFDERRSAQERLGWTVSAQQVDGMLTLSITDAAGMPVEVQELNALLGRPTHVKEDSEPAFVFDGTAYVAPMDLDDGNWDLRMIATAEDGTEYRQRLKVRVIR